MKKSNSIKSTTMLMPAGILLLIFFGYPLVKIFIDSSFSIQLFDLGAKEFIGLNNFVEVLTSTRFHNIIYNTMLYVLIAVSVEFLLGLLLATLLNTKFKGHQISRTILLSPLMLAPLVSSLIWKFMLSSQFGLVNWLLYYVGIIKNPESILWLSDPKLSLFSTIIADIWLTTPFMMLVLLAGLQGIPNQLFESAQIDGANKWQIFRYITLPMLKPVATISILIRMIDAARQFEITWTLTKGGPHFSSEIISTFVYQTLTRYGEIGKASTMAVIFTVVLFFIGLIFISKVWSPSEN